MDSEAKLEETEECHGSPGGIIPAVYAGGSWCGCYRARGDHTDAGVHCNICTRQVDRRQRGRLGIDLRIAY